mmetsp:Transcript_47301/g.88603  ORF Transcript_47301/g.88603 Transcript_47301/m.88603 type:complete len:408 (+) Transcript_47301:46-1269(+)
MGQSLCSGCDSCTSDAGTPKVEEVFTEVSGERPQQLALEEEDLTAEKEAQEPMKSSSHLQTPSTQEASSVAFTFSASSTVVAPSAGTSSSSLELDAQAQVAEADRLMREGNLFAAADLLRKAIQTLEAAGNSAAIAALRESEAFRVATWRAADYMDLASLLVLQQPGLSLVWEGGGSRLWVKTSSRQDAGSKTAFEYRVATDIDASLSSCLAYSNELDLLPSCEPMLVAAPETLGPAYPLLMITRSLIGILGFRVELIFEVFRVCDDDFGFLTENIRSDFPEDGVPMPKRHWRYRRINITTKNIWIPRGGGESGTTCMQVVNVELGFHIPDIMLKKVIATAAKNMITGLQTNSEKAAKPGSKWQDRLESDKSGFYTMCRRAEAAAAKRSAISANNLPTAEIFKAPVF